jgi:hypothetical protein
VKGADQRAGILPGSREGPAAGEQQSAARLAARQGTQHDRPEVFHVLREQPSPFRAGPGEYLFVGLRAQVRPIRDRDHVVTAVAEFRRDDG